MRRRGPSLKQIVDEVNVSEIEAVLRPCYKKWCRGDGHAGRPPHNPVGLALALLIKLLRGWSDADLVGFLEAHPEWVRFLGLEKVPEESVWSKLLDRIPESALDDLLGRLVRDLRKKGFLFLSTLAADGSFIPACNHDPDARWGYVRRLDKRRGLPSGRYVEQEGKILGFGYRIHVLVDATRGLPVAVHVSRADTNDASEWDALYKASRGTIGWGKVLWFTADKGYDVAHVRESLEPWDAQLAIPAANTPARLKYGGFKGERARVYRKRTSVERFFSMLKSFFGLLERNLITFDRVRKWLKLAVLASLVMGWVNHQRGNPVHSVTAFNRLA